MKQEKPERFEEYKKQLGRRIKSLRIKKGYTNYEFFAYDTEISRTQYGRYEQGEDIRFSTIVRLAKAFDVTLPEFFSEGFEEKEKSTKRKNKDSKKFKA